MVMFFSRFYGKVGVIFWFLFHLIWKNYGLSWDFDLKSWIVDFFTCFTREKAPQNNFSSQNFSVENNYCDWKKMSVWLEVFGKKQELWKITPSLCVIFWLHLLKSSKCYLLHIYCILVKYQFFKIASHFVFDHTFSPKITLFWSPQDHPGNLYK